MAKYLIDLSDGAIADFKKHKKSGNKVIMAKITRIFEDLENHPYTGVGQSENLLDKWSRRLNHN